LQKHKGDCPVKISYNSKHLTGSIALNKALNVVPNQALVDAINKLTQTQSSKIYYH
jgi:DNA polymerase-3 subunit alpha